MAKKLLDKATSWPVSRRSLLRGGAGLIGGTILSGGMNRPTMAADQPPIGTWPAGSLGDKVFIGASVPRTGTYAVQGEDELKGYQLAIEHINEGNELIRKISPKTKKASSASSWSSVSPTRPRSRMMPCRRSSASYRRTRRL